MENVFKYYEFSEFFKDTSENFSGNEICYTELNTTHFLIFEKVQDSYNLYISRYKTEKDIGINPPEILETLVNDYQKSNPKHRALIKQYIY